MKKKFIILIVLVVGFLILDQWTKHLVHKNFSWGESKPIVSGFFSLTYVRNSGAAFGILHKAPPAFRDPFFIAVPLIALFVIIFLFVRLQDNQLFTAGALSLILSGAVGNLIDRLRFGFVIDFLDFFIKDYHWPAFNVADSCIVVGVSILFIQSFFQSKVESHRVNEHLKT